MKKLALRREVLRQLTPRDAVAAAGGLVIGPPRTFTILCVTVSCECTQICPTL